ncbi:MAG: MoaD/ThiS family protein [Betaproteobacteria bacterium]
MLDTRTETLHVVYLARLREAFASSGEAFAFAGDGTTVAEVIETLRGRGGAWATELAPGRAVRIAVNQVMASPSTRVHAGDEVALFPPVTGG